MRCASGGETPPDDRDTGKEMMQRVILAIIIRQDHDADEQS